MDKISDATIARAISDYNLIDLTAEDYAWALENEQGKDFEDALQVAMALRAGCTNFITLDKRLAKAYAHLPMRFVVPGSQV